MQIQANKKPHNWNWWNLGKTHPIGEGLAFREKLLFSKKRFGTRVDENVVEPKIGGFYPPKWMVKIMETSIKMGDLGGKTPLFLETSIFSLNLIDQYGSKMRGLFFFGNGLRNAWLFFKDKRYFRPPVLATHTMKCLRPKQFFFVYLNQWLFLVPLKGGRWHIIPQLAVYATYILVPLIPEPTID